MMKRKKHNKIVSNQEKNERLIMKEKFKAEEENRRKVLCSKIDREMGNMKLVTNEFNKQKKIHHRIEEDRKKEEAKILNYRSKISDHLKNKKSANTNMTKMKEKEQAQKNAYDEQQSHLYKSLIDVENEQKKTINPHDYRDPMHAVHGHCHSTPKLQSIGKWADAIMDPKMCHKANKKVWERFGYGMDWQKIGKGK